MQAQDSTHPTGVAGQASTQGVNGNAVGRSRIRKSNAAVELRLAGATWTEIATVLGYPTPRAAMVATEKALEREMKASSEQDKEKMRQICGMRLERMVRTVWKKANNPDDPENLSAQREVRGHIAQFARLHGLDAPTEVVVHTPTYTEMQAWAARQIARITPQADEADIFEGIEEAEVVDESRLIES